MRKFQYSQILPPNGILFQYFSTQNLLNTFLYSRFFSFYYQYKGMTWIMFLKYALSSRKKSLNFFFFFNVSLLLSVSLFTDIVFGILGNFNYISRFSKNGHMVQETVFILLKKMRNSCVMFQINILKYIPVLNPQGRVI